MLEETKGNECHYRHEFADRFLTLCDKVGADHSYRLDQDDNEILSMLQGGPRRDVWSIPELRCAHFSRWWKDCLNKGFEKSVKIGSEPMLFALVDAWFCVWRDLIECDEKYCGLHHLGARSGGLSRHDMAPYCHKADTPTIVEWNNEFGQILRKGQKVAFEVVRLLGEPNNLRAIATGTIDSLLTCLHSIAGVATSEDATTPFQMGYLVLLCEFMEEFRHFDETQLKDALDVAERNVGALVGYLGRYLEAIPIHGTEEERNRTRACLIDAHKRIHGWIEKYEDDGNFTLVGAIRSAQNKFVAHLLGHTKRGPRKLLMNDSLLRARLKPCLEKIRPPIDLRVIDISTDTGGDSECYGQGLRARAVEREWHFEQSENRKQCSKRGTMVTPHRICLRQGRHVLGHFENGILELSWAGKTLRAVDCIAVRAFDHLRGPEKGENDIVLFLDVGEECTALQDWRSFVAKLSQRIYTWTDFLK